MDRTIKVCAAVIRKSGRTLVCRRPHGKDHSGMWEFPGGKLNDGETNAECLRREMSEELGADIAVMDCLLEHAHQYPGKKVLLRFYRAQILSGDASLEAREGQEFKWVETGRICEMGLLPADIPIAKFLWESESTHNKTSSKSVIQ